MCFWNDVNEEYYDEFLFGDASFKICDPLTKLKFTKAHDQEFMTLSLESVNYPNFYLKHDDEFECLVVEKLKHTDEDNSAATWIFENGTLIILSFCLVLVLFQVKECDPECKNLSEKLRKRSEFKQAVKTDANEHAQEFKESIVESHPLHHQNQIIKVPQQGRSIVCF